MRVVPALPARGRDDPVYAAPLTDAGLTPHHAVRRSWAKLSPTSTAVVIGVGGLGHLAVQILKATTAAPVIAVDMRPEALQLPADGAPISPKRPACSDRGSPPSSSATLPMPIVGLAPVRWMDVR